ncbi:hypothetical protein CVT25_011629 [Psilocybe cyanescens]|uniref:F-box domain-containing protein n=1 Tax=Psilocybe cyanescens TaxID=93625 RepID=A0A409WIJ6_PSICY|nr:hypothetical protein CVT25_011629 [Psilocybe cyanescens]
MDRCPSEICSEICAFACTDDGRTGRSLSLVSRFLNQSSKPYKLQSVAVVGHAQLHAFAALIERTPLSLRRVACIFVSAHSRQTASDPRLLAPEYVQRQDAYAAVGRILRAIAPCVRVVHAFFVFYRPFILLPVSLPALEELTLHGPLDSSAALDRDIEFPALRHLDLTSSCAPSYVLDKVLKLTPRLAHLRISASDRSELVANDWSALVSVEDKRWALPGHLERIYVHAPTQPGRDAYTQLQEQFYGRIMRALEFLAETDERVVLLRPLQYDLFSMVSIQTAITTWSASADGIHWW